MFVYGRENLNESGAFTYSKDKNVAGMSFTICKLADLLYQTNIWND